MDSVWDERLIALAEAAERKIEGRLRELDRTAERNQWKVIRAFRKHRVSDFHFNGSTGYGYNDRGRETLDLVYADVLDRKSVV